MVKSQLLLRCKSMKTSTRRWIGGVLVGGAVAGYFVTGALNDARGKEIWRFGPGSYMTLEGPELPQQWRAAVALGVAIIGLVALAVPDKSGV